MNLDFEFDELFGEYEQLKLDAIAILPWAREYNWTYLNGLGRVTCKGCHEMFNFDNDMNHKPDCKIPAALEALNRIFAFIKNEDDE
jgi:hypothetical protein